MSQTVEPSGLAAEFPDPSEASVVYDPSLERLRALASGDETTTEYGSPSYVSDQRSRSADRTKSLVDDEFTAADWQAIERALVEAGERELICLDRQVGRHPAVAVTCRLYVPTEYARIALAWAKLLEPATGEPAFRTLQLPDWDGRRIRVLPDAGLTFVLGSDYTGEAKKSFLRLFMYRAKQRGGLGLHAGTKRVCVDAEDGLRTVGQAFLGLSATGKSTLTGHGCWLDEPEGAQLLQDDVCALLPSGEAAGSEGGGLYIKTDGLDNEEQPGLYRAATDESAVLENVRVEPDGRVDFDDTALTANGRAVVRREQLASAAGGIDLERVDQLFFITRNPMMPPVARLDPRQAAAAFMLGESIQTSAGDPDAAGEPIRVVGTNPFIIGPKGEEGNRFYDLVRASDVECFLMNTGHVGEVDVGVCDSVTVLVNVARGTVDWEYDPAMNLELPASMPGLDVGAFYPPAHYEQFDRELEALRTERREYLERFETLREEIKEAVY